MPGTILMSCCMCFNVLRVWKVMRVSMSGSTLMSCCMCFNELRVWEVMRVFQCLDLH